MLSWHRMNSECYIIFLSCSIYKECMYVCMCLLIQPCRMRFSFLLHQFYRKDTAATRACLQSPPQPWPLLHPQPRWYRPILRESRDVWSISAWCGARKSLTSVSSLWRYPSPTSFIFHLHHFFVCVYIIAAHTYPAILGSVWLWDVCASAGRLERVWNTGGANIHTYIHTLINSYLRNTYIDIDILCKHVYLCIQIHIHTYIDTDTRKIAVILAQVLL